MKDLLVPSIITSVCAVLGSLIAWIFGGTIWIGALIGALISIAFCAGAMLAVIGMIQIAADYIKEKSR